MIYKSSVIFKFFWIEKFEKTNLKRKMVKPIMIYHRDYSDFSLLPRLGIIGAGFIVYKESY